ncbi:MAG: MerR family transcriptional regulator [Oscillospiraceae bacterium]|jgi:DNA-binding transcriptional MerR regulator|nr:MerR family transcriptional regulator [Oscillospiraceae bacterium]
MNTGLLSISELAKFSRVSRTALLHYDKVGLIKPISRSDNNYRHYSDEHIAVVNLVRTLQHLGMSLKDITFVAHHRSPQSILDLFSEQIGNIDRDIKSLIKARKLMTNMINVITDAKDVDESAIVIARLPEEHIFLGPPNDYSNGRTLNAALLDFYKWCKMRDDDMDLNYSAWGTFSADRLKRGDWVWPDRFYFNNPDGADIKPEGLYVTGYTRGNYGAADGLYNRLMAYIDSNKLKLIGPSYETYPLNEISVMDPNEYLIRVSILVEE